MITAPLPKSAELPIGACANAREPIRLNVVARTIVVNFMLPSFLLRERNEDCRGWLQLQSSPLAALPRLGSLVDLTEWMALPFLTRPAGN